MRPVHPRPSRGRSRARDAHRPRDAGCIVVNAEHSPLHAGAHAELIVLGIRHPDPASVADALYTFVESLRSETFQPLDFGFDVVDDDVEVHAVLRRLGLRYALEYEWWRNALLRHQHREVRVLVVLAVVECRAPEVGELRRLGT